MPLRDVQLDCHHSSSRHLRTNAHRLQRSLKMEPPIVSLSSMTPDIAKVSLEKFKSEIFRTKMSKAALATCDGLGAHNCTLL